MPIIKLPDGKDLVFDKKVTGLEVSEKIMSSTNKKFISTFPRYTCDLVVLR